MTLRTRLPAAVAPLLVLLACGTETGSTTGSVGTDVVAPTTRSPETTPAESTTTTILVEACMEPATEVAFGSRFESALSTDETKAYLCVEVPEGVPLLRIELAGNELDLFVGYPHLENLTGGGQVGVEFWTAEEEAGVQVVTVEPLLRPGGLENTRDEFVRPGSYYLEVSGPGSSEFSLLVTEG